MVYNSGYVSEQSITRKPSFEAADAGEDVALYDWINESMLELPNPTSEAPSQTRTHSLSWWNSPLDSDNHFLGLVELAHGSLEGAQASEIPCNIQQGYQAEYYAQHYYSFNDTGAIAPPTAFVPSQIPDSFALPEAPFLTPPLGNLHYAHNAPGQYYPSQMLASNTISDYLQYLDTALYYSTGVQTQVPENTGTSIKPLQMHLHGRVEPLEVEAESEENAPSQVQIASSSSTTVEQLLPQLLPTRGRKRKRVSEYETPNTIELEEASRQDEKYDPILERCRKYREVLKDGRIICRCAQDPELRGDHEWKRGHKTKQEFICENCDRLFKRKDSMTKHVNQHCRSKVEEN
ncbi:hypothetical protein OPQ81_006705 [Rhizoctonia solani]|nr:hypothetical protein OPQ81_006705 [Rhizoctonia solani]